MKEKFMGILVLQFSAFFINFFSTYLLFLNIDVSIMGSWAFVVSNINIGFMFYDLGFTIIHYKYSSRENFEDYFGTFLTIKLFLLILNSLFTMALITALGLWASKYIPYLLIIFFSMFFSKIAYVFIYNLKSKKKLFRSQIPIFILSSLNGMTIGYLALNLDLFKDPLLFLSGTQLFYNFLLFILIILLSKKSVKITKPRKDIAKCYYKDAKYLILYSILLIIGSNIGNLIVFSSFGEETLGYFNLVNTYLFKILGVITLSLGEVFYVYFAVSFKKKNFREIKSMIYSIEKYSSILFLGIAIITFVNGDLLIRLFLPNYLNSVPILYALILIPYCSAITSPYARQMRIGGKQKEAALFDSLTLTLKIILLFILIPPNIFHIPSFGLGIWGYTIAIIIQWIFAVIGYRVFSKKYFNIPYQKSILKHLIFAMSIIIISLWIKNTILSKIVTNLYLLLIFSTLFSLGLFVLLLYFTKELGKEDVKFFKSLLNIKNYYQSFREEFN
jgi:O-antigen/teichoic acid export membrane protein